jgi:hypothetical protein
MQLVSNRGDMMQKRSAGELEGEVTGIVESQTAKIPSGVFLGAAVGSMAVSAVLKASGKEDWAQFIAHWAPAFLILGLYNKMVKQNGTDSRGRRTLLREAISV